MLTPGNALGQRYQRLHSLHMLANQFGADRRVIVEMTGKMSRVEAFLKPIRIIKSTCTGVFFFF